MSQAAMDNTIRLVVPGGEAHLGVARTVVGRAAMITGFTFDGIEDLALAVHEAMALLLSAAPRELMVITRPVGEGLVVEVSIDDRALKWPPDGVTDDVSWHLLTALCDRIWLLDGGAGIGLAQDRR